LILKQLVPSPPPLFTLSLIRVNWPLNGHWPINGHFLTAMFRVYPVSTGHLTDISCLLIIQLGTVGVAGHVIVSSLCFGYTKFA